MHFYGIVVGKDSNDVEDILYQYSQEAARLEENFDDDDEEEEEEVKQDEI